MSWVSVLEMAHALNSTQIFHQLISVVSEEKDMEHFPDLGSVTSSVWNFCARFDSQTSFQGDIRGGVTKCRLFCQTIGKSSVFF